MALLAIFLPVLFLYNLVSQRLERAALADPILLSVARKKSL